MTKYILSHQVQFLMTNQGYARDQETLTNHRFNG